MSIFGDTESTVRVDDKLVAIALCVAVGLLIGLLFGMNIGKSREHDRICNSPQPPLAAPVAIPACGVYPYQGQK